MASILKHRGRWRATVTVAGSRESKSFDKKMAARAWAEKREHELRLTGDGRGRSLSDAFVRYANTVSVKKKGERWERIRLQALGEDLGFISLDDLKPVHIANWRDKRLLEVKPATVRRELVLITNCCEYARREWGWLATNPCRDVKKPPDSKPRTQRFTDGQIKDIAVWLGYGRDTVGGRVAAAFLFAIETAMRAGEIAALTGADVVGRVATVRDSKNGEMREVPLSKRAAEIWAEFPNGFGLSSMQISSNYLRAARALDVDVRFHDARREATSRLAKKLEVLELARVTGHKNIKQLLTYYQHDAESLASKLD